MKDLKGVKCNYLLVDVHLSISYTWDAGQFTWTTGLYD